MNPDTTYLSSSSSTRRRPAPLSLNNGPALQTERSRQVSNEPASPAPLSPRLRDPVKPRTSGYGARGSSLPASASLDSSLNALLAAQDPAPPAASPAAPLSRSHSNFSNASSSPESARNVDRSTLVGLAELTTPRWAHSNSWGTFADAASPVSLRCFR
jgi:hypothetical protein